MLDGNLLRSSFAQYQYGNIAVAGGSESYAGDSDGREGLPGGGTIGRWMVLVGKGVPKEVRAGRSTPGQSHSAFETRGGEGVEENTGDS